MMRYKEGQRVVERLMGKYERRCREKAHEGESALYEVVRLAFVSGKEGEVGFDEWLGCWDKTLGRVNRNKTVGGNDVRIEGA